jgi:hypothetical protein
MYKGRNADAISTFINEGRSSPFNNNKRSLFGNQVIQHRFKPRVLIQNHFSNISIKIV